MKTALLIPCHNESSCIGKVLRELKEQVPDAVCIAVNDGSTDDTAQQIRAAARENANIVLLDLPVNLGIGGAVQTGFRYAARHGFDCAVKVDGDGQHPAPEIRKLIAEVETRSADMVIGSRFLTHEGFQSTSCRRVGIHIFRLLNSMLTGQRVTDNTSGFRAYSRAALEFAAAHYPAFDYPEPEEVVLMKRNGFVIKEVPVTMRERQGGVSSIHPGRAVYYMVKVIFSVLMAAIRPPERKSAE